MLEAKVLIRLSGFALIVAGCLYLPLPFIDAWMGIDDIGGRNWWFVSSAATIHHFFLLFGLIGLFVAQLEPAGKLGLAAFLLTSLGNALVAGISIVKLTVLSAFAAHPDAQTTLICTPFYEAATRAATGFIEQACAAWQFGALDAWNTSAWLSYMIGSIILAVSIARARVLPVIAGVLLGAGWLIALASFFLPLPELLGASTFSIVGIAYVWCGWSLVRQNGSAESTDSLTG